MEDNSKKLEIGQHVWVLRTGGACQRATIESIMDVSSPAQDNPMCQVTVQWIDEQSGEVMGKIVSSDDVFPSTPFLNIQPTINEDDQAGRVVDKSIECSDEPENPQLPVSSCHICGLAFKGLRGVRLHVAKKHPAEANSMKLNTLFRKRNVPTGAANASSLQPDIDQWLIRFNTILKNVKSIDLEEFDLSVQEFLHYLRSANQQLPGPKHPAVRYFQLRNKNKEQKERIRVSDKGASKVSNPHRSNKRSRERRQEAFQYELAQFNYYNRRKKVVNDIMNSDAPKQCPISVEKIQQHYKKIFEEPNSTSRENYTKSSINPDIVSISLEAVHKAIKSTSLDTSPGLDGVYVRTIKALHVAPIIRTIGEIMLRSAYIPQAFRKGKTILLYKGKGLIKDTASWRPITVYSIVRRIIEKVLDVELRKQVGFHSSQRGFVKGMPGCHINARIVDAILKDAKQKGKSAVVALLDVVGAFDNVGHHHIIKVLEEKGISADLRNLISALLSSNTINICVGSKKTKDISIKRGVPQGAPLSPTLFNLAIDFLYKEVCDPGLANSLGYKLSGKEGILLTGFADDQAVTTENSVDALRAVDLIQRLFREIGLCINPEKSSAIIVRQGLLVGDQLMLENGEQIASVQTNEVIKYLGCTFSNELVVNENSVHSLNDNLNKLTTSNLLKPDQKLNVLNQYLFPMVTYPLQTAPLTKLRSSLLEGIDVMIRRSVKCMLGLPANTSNAMLYAPRRYRGLGVLKCEWEAPLQHLSIARKLHQVQDPTFQEIFNFNLEVAECAGRLGTSVEDLPISIRMLRQNLREKSFEEWTRCKWQGIGVHHYKECPKLNQFVYNKEVLSSSEWVNALKLNTNYAPLRGVPGVANSAVGDIGPLCRKCGRENETPAHVVGNCPNNMLLVTRRHHRVKHTIMKWLEEKKYTCFEEVYAVDSEGSTRYADIIAFGMDGGMALIIDPTIRYESNDSNQAEKVDAEKRNIYEKCIPYYKEKFRDHFGDRVFKVVGLLFGARGTIPKLTLNFFDEVGINQKMLSKLTEEIILDSLGIINHHIYS